MIKADLKIKCWKCGKEETIVEAFEDSVVDINLDKLCSNCNAGWMMKKELTLQKLMPIFPYWSSRWAENGPQSTTPENHSQAV